MAYAAAITMLIVLLGVFWFDRPVYLFMRQLDCPLWGFFDVIFDAKVWVCVSAFIVAIFYVKKCLETKCNYRNDRNRVSLPVFLRDFFVKTKCSYAFFIFCSVLSASLVTKVIKVVVGRFRPIFFEALDMTGFRPFSFEWAFNSMPSGHSTASFAGLVMLGMLAPRLKWFTWTLAIVIGASRVAFGAHWPTDVILGAFIGMVMADFVKSALKQNK